MATGAPTAMPTDIDLLTLSQWLSPAYPVGAFSYSHGLEWAVDVLDVTDAATYDDWLRQVLVHGTGRNDAILLSNAYRAPDSDALAQIDTLARALAPSKERLMETELQGAAFIQTTAAIWPNTLPELTYPVAVGAAAAAHGLALSQTLQLYLHAFAANLTSAAIRLVPLGQTEGQAVLAGISPICVQLASQAQTQTPRVSHE